MSLPFHQYASTPLAIPAALAVERLRAEPSDLVTSATANSLRAVAPSFAQLGLTPTVLPATQARATEEEELGAVEVVWEGEEQLTGWPALTGRLLVVPEADASSRLVLLSTRSPEADLRVANLDRLHRLRVVDVAVQRFLHDLAAELGGRTEREPNSSAIRYDRTPLFLHHQEVTECDPDRLRKALAAYVAGLADRVTSAALVRAGESLRAGRFRAVPAPLVEAEATPPGELGVVRIGWRTDEEATGWPDIDLVLVVTAGSEGADLCVLSSREPGYDLSLNRIDRHQRDQLLRQAGPAVAMALLEEVAADTASAESPVAARSLVASGADASR